MFRPLWLAFRGAVLATAVFWVAKIIVEKLHWQAPLDLTEQLIFFVIFFLGMLMIEKK
ncbi:hypothetical protein [Reyranella sp.]|jgi:hypothetical protein|uniref:hypothetical protein n=1 Tax=Reyranella sp. TaxID=1929291 RepID=UPI002F92E4D7